MNALAFKKVEKGIAISYIHGIIRTLSSILNHAVEDGIITSNVATRPGRFVKVPKDRDGIVALTPEEGKHFLGTGKKAAPRYHALFAAALFTGARQGELLGLQWGDIQLEWEVHRDSAGEVHGGHSDPEVLERAADGYVRCAHGHLAGAP